MNPANKFRNNTILTKNENKKCDFCVLPIFDCVIMDGHPLF